MASHLLSLPRLLCLHGGGTNSAIFALQLRPLMNHALLKDKFRLVFCEAPFSCEAGIGVVPVYEHLSPFYRWSRWLKTHPAVDARECHRQILTNVKEAMAADQGSGDWVGIVGFSQGGKVACSLLLLQQLEAETGSQRTVSANFRFGIIMAARAPLLALNDRMEDMVFMQSAAGLSSEADADAILDSPESRLRIPTLHIHGLRDDGLEHHRRCADQYCLPGTARVVEWDGGHRLVIKSKDVQTVAEAFTELWNEHR